MKNDSTNYWLRSLSFSVFASVFIPGAARADLNDLPTIASSGFNWQAAIHKHRHGNLSTPGMAEVMSRGAQRYLRIQRNAEELSRSISANRQYPHMMNRMSHVGIGLPRRVLSFQTAIPSLNPTSSMPGVEVTDASNATDAKSVTQSLVTDTPRRSAYLNYEGDEKHLSKGFSLDLSSTDANVIVGSNLLNTQSVTINVGDTSKQVSAGSLVTPAEFAALNQKLADGTQSLTLSNGGAATGGALHLNLISDDGRTIRSSSLVVPENVSVVGDFARAADGIRITKDVVNSGSIFAISTKSERTLAVISASNVINNAAGLITTNVPESVSGNPSKQLDLAVRADERIENFGAITSSANLELSGTSIHNVGNVEAKSHLFLNTSTVKNTGLLQSLERNISISAPLDSSLSIDNTGGEIRAAQGDINLATKASLNPKLNTNLLGGDWHSKQLNISSADGNADAVINDVTGVVNIKAGASHFHANADNLTLGNIELSGDPTFSNSGNLILSGLGLVTGGAPLALIAGGNITAGTATVIDTSNGAGAGGDLTIVAGADFTISGNILSITGALPAGGNIDLTGITKISTKGTTNGGNVQIVAFNPSFGPTTGNITIPSSTTITTGGGGSGDDGSVLILSESKSSGVNVGGIDTRGGSGLFGSIVVRVLDVLLTNGVIQIDNTTGAIIQGTFLPDFALTEAPISVGNLHTQGGEILLTTGSSSTSTSTVSTGDLDTGITVAGKPLGDVFIVALGGLTVDGYISTHDLSVISSRQVNFDNLSSITILTDSAGNGGSIDISADTLTSASKELALSAIGTALGKGGSIDLSLNFTSVTPTINPIIIGGPGSNYKLDAHGGTSGGSVTVLNFGTITVNPGGINAAGANGSGSKFHLSSLDSIILNDTSFLSQANATGNNGNGGLIDIKAVLDVTYANSSTSPLVLSANGIGTGNGGKIDFGAAVNNVPLYIGSPPKAPKGLANYIKVSAKSGALGGDGGSISVRNGTSITVDMKAFDASAQSKSGKWNGASYSLDANGGTNTSNLIINGSINADGINGGDAGAVSLESNNSKSAFVLNSGKTPKNGISGTISANGNLGSISVLNEHGGIKVNSTQALSADSISLIATGDAQSTKAKITGKKAVITAGQNLSLTGYNGIGTLSVSAPNVSLNSQVGKVSVSSVPTTSVTLLDSFGGAGFTFKSAGLTTLNDIGTNAGAISVTGGNGGLLQVAANSTIEAKNSSVALINLDTVNGAIQVGNNSKILTSGVKAGDTIIAIGKAKKTNPFNNVNPPNMNVTQINGTVYFGPDPSGVVATGPTVATITANKTNVVFSNASTNSAANKITLGSAVSVIGGQ